MIRQVETIAEFTGPYQISGPGAAMIAPTLDAVAMFLACDVFELAEVLNVYGFGFYERGGEMVCVTPAMAVGSAEVH